MKVRALRGRHLNRIGTIVNYEDTPHGRLNVVLFDGDDFELYLDKEVEVIG